MSGWICAKHFDLGTVSLNDCYYVFRWYCSSSILEAQGHCDLQHASIRWLLRSITARELVFGAALHQVITTAWHRRRRLSVPREVAACSFLLYPPLDSSLSLIFLQLQLVMEKET
jgi:hypothetical protein